MSEDSPNRNPFPLSLHLLILEDVPEDVELIVLALEAAGIIFTYETVATASAFHQLIAHNSYSAVLSDYRLPNFNGLQAFDLLQQSEQDIPFILITGSLGEEAAVEFIKTGMTDYVLKDRLFRLPTVLQRALQEFELRRQQKAAIAQIQQQAWREAIINQIVQAMRETLVLDEVLQTTVDQLHEALQVSRCVMFQPDSKQQAIIRHVSQFTDNGKRFLGITCNIYEYHQAVLAQDQAIVLHEIDESLPAHIRETAAEYSIHSIMIVPLFYQRSHLGGICLQQCDRQRTWTENEQTLVQAIADQCAIAIHQAQLYQQAQTELAERKRMEAQLRHDAFHDVLTGLPNRALFMDRLKQALQLTTRRSSRQSRTPPYQFAVLFLDLDRFKVINDSLGHTIGDQLLKTVAERLQSCLRMGDTVARLGGDEFVILLEDIAGINDAIEVAHRIHQDLKTPIFLDGHEVFISASIGIAISAAHYTQPAQLLRDADTAMYRAKSCVRGGYEVFDTSMHTHVVRQLQLENDLRRAIARQEFRLYYQPIVSLLSRQIHGFEALVRWQHPEQGLISPVEFIPIAEDTGLIMPIDLWVLREACHTLRQFQQLFPPIPLTMSVNLSAKQFSQPDLIPKIDQVLQEIGLEGDSLKLEITESVLIENAELANTILKQLRSRNIQVCIDDFGTGYSSLSYLHRFPINTLKIDRSFVARLESETENQEITKAIINLGSNLNLTVVAEGIETEQQYQFLQENGCHEGQGYWFSQPCDRESIIVLLQQQLHSNSQPSS